MATKSASSPTQPIVASTLWNNWLSVFMLPQPNGALMVNVDVTPQATTSVPVGTGTIVSQTTYHINEAYVFMVNETAVVHPGSQTPMLSVIPTLVPASTTRQNDPQTSTTESSTSETLSSQDPSVTFSPPRNSTSVTSKKGVSDGAAAGIGVGCFLIGALISGFLLWFLLRRKGQGRRDHEAGRLPFLHGEKSMKSKVQSLGNSSLDSSTIDNILPQPLEDKAISGDVSKISTLIKNHVQSYYHTGRVSPGTLDITDLQALGNDMPISSGTLSTLLANSATREIALRFVIAWVVITRVQAPGDPQNSFLPPEVSQLLFSVSSENRVSLIFLSKWRVFTSTLLQSSYATNTIRPSDNRVHSIQKAIDVLEGILYSYADSRIDHDRRRQNLEEILKRAAVFAFTLFSQPSSWVFDWKEEQSVKAGSLCIFPALSQVTDESGEKLQVPREFNEAVTRQLDE